MFGNKDFRNTLFTIKTFFLIFILFLSDLCPCMLAGKVTTSTGAKYNLRWSSCAHI